MTEYNNQLFTATYFQSLQRLFKSTFNADVPFRSYQKKYDTELLGARAINFISVDRKSDEMVAHYAALPFKFLVQNHVGLAAQASDAMTDASHRKKGLFKTLADEVHHECEKKGFSFIISQPNNASYHSFLNVFKFQHVDTIIRWDLKLRVKTPPVGKRLIYSKFKKTYLHYCKAVLKTYLVLPPQSLINSLRSDDARVLRDHHYIAYKKSDDSFFIEIEGALLWIKLTDIFWIGEIDDYEKINTSVLKKLRRVAFLLGYNTISFHLNQKVPQPTFLKYFKNYNSEPSTIFYFDKNYNGLNLILTGVDFDTW